MYALSLINPFIHRIIIIWTNLRKDDCMGSFVNRGNESFSRARNSQIYIDKTGLLNYTNSVINTEQSYICVSRPRRFGKTLTAGMLMAYYCRGCNSETLFTDLAIADSPSFKKHLNQYDVIHLDIAYLLVQIKNPSKTISCLQEYVIEELKTIYPGILSDDEQMLPFALSKIHQAKGAAFIIIIDEWDAIFREDRYDTNAQREYIQLLRGLFKGEQSKDFVKLAYITGILPIKKYNSESALNNFDEFTMAGPKRLAEYVGFTESEVARLCQEYDMDFSEAARWYDGYSFPRMKHVYNPNSIVKAMLSGEYDNYWTKTVTYESLKNYISMNFDGLKDCVVQMLAGGRCHVNTDTFENDMTSFKSRDDVLTVLIHLGYLAYDRDRKEVYVPNEEVRTAFANAVGSTDWTPVVEAMEKSRCLLTDTWNKDEEAVAKGVEMVHMANVSLLEYNNENALSCVITLAYYHAVNEYTLIRELPSGNGCADLVFLPRKYSDKPAMVVELKYNHSAQSAIWQIKEKHYPKALEDYKGNLLLVGIEYDKKTKIHSCRIQEWAAGGRPEHD